MNLFCCVVLCVCVCLSVPSTRRPHNPASIHHLPPTSHFSRSYHSIRHPRLRPHSHWQQRYSINPRISTAPSACLCIFPLTSLCPVTSLLAQAPVFLSHAVTLWHLNQGQNFCFIYLFFYCEKNVTCCLILSLVKLLFTLLCEHQLILFPQILTYICTLRMLFRFSDSLRQSGSFHSKGVELFKFSVHCPLGISKTSVLLCFETSKKQMSCPTENVCSLETSHRDS